MASIPCCESSDGGVNSNPGRGVGVREGVPPVGVDVSESTRGVHERISLISGVHNIPRQVGVRETVSEEKTEVPTFNTGVAQPAISRNVIALAAVRGRECPYKAIPELYTGHCVKIRSIMNRPFIQARRVDDRSDRGQDTG
jgi:hypothetical protein